MPEVENRFLTFGEAIREGLDQALERDSRVIVIGEGVPDPKAIFNTTAGLRKKYGNNRVFDMPLSENGVTGVCIGAALSGLRPVMVHQRVDFSLLALDQIINNAAKWHYMFNGRASVPMVVRMIIGRGWGQGPQHSQSLQAIFAQVPGLKVVMPTTAHDAKGLLIAAIEDDNPVISIEHRWLFQVKDEVPKNYYRIPLNKARVLHQGSDITVAAFSYMTLEALIAAKALFSHMEIGVEVIDMRSVRPLDMETVLDSVYKTGRLIVADTAFHTGSIAGELISQVVEKAFDALKKPPVRIASPDYPVPTSHFMTENYYPNSRTIVDAVLELVGANLKQNLDYKKLCDLIVRKVPHDVPSPEFSGPF